MEKENQTGLSVDKAAVGSEQARFVNQDWSIGRVEKYLSLAKRNIFVVSVGRMEKQLLFRLLETEVFFDILISSRIKQVIRKLTTKSKI